MVNRDTRERVLAAASLVEERIHESVSVQDMADEACYSLFHFCRVFNRLAWFSPYDYAMRRRITHAARVIMQDRTPVTRIALDHGFGTPDGFTRAFRRMFGLSPQAARDSGFIDQRAFLHPLDHDRLDILSRCVPAPDETRIKVEKLRVRVTSAETAVEALSSMIHRLTLEESWVGLVSNENGSEAQVCAGSTELFEGHPFTIDIPAGTYRSLHLLGAVSDLPMLGELMYSTIVHRIGGCHRPDRLFIRIGPEDQDVLIECVQPSRQI